MRTEITELGTMVNLRGTRVRALLMFLCIGCVTSGAALRSLPFQGCLTDAGGVMLDGEYAMRFVIYNEPSGGSAVWPGEIHRTSVSRGLVNVLLGTRVPFGDSVDFGEGLYLEVTIDSNDDGAITAADPPLAPRQAITVSPYAHNAAAAAEAVHAAEATHANSSAEAAGLNAPEGQPLKLKTDDTVRMTVATDGAVGIGKTPEHALDVQGTVRAASFVGDGSLLSGTVPPGTVVPFAGITVPDGWLLCDGQGLRGSEYALLYAAIGTTWGGGTGGDTDFSLPDLRGRVVAGMDTGQSEFNALGKTGGEKTHILTVAEMPSHTHTVTGDNDAVNNGRFTLTGQGSYGWTKSTNATGGGQPHNNMPPFAVLNFIIKY